MKTRWSRKPINRLFKRSVLRAAFSEDRVSSQLKKVSGMGKIRAVFYLKIQFSGVGALHFFFLIANWAPVYFHVKSEGF